MKANRFLTWGAAGVSLAFLGACASSKQETKAESPVVQAQKESTEALKKAQDAQKKADAAEAKATSAQAQVDKDRQKLSQDAQNAQRARAEAQQAQAQAQQTTQQAHQQAQASQQRAMSGQQQAQQQRSQEMQAYHQAEARSAAQGGQAISGRIVQVAPNKIVLKPENQPEVSLNIDNNSNVMLDGKKVSVQQLPQGAQARASYEFQNGQFQLKSLNAVSP